MTRHAGMIRSRRHWFERVVLAMAILFVVGVLTRYDLCFQDPETLTASLPHALEHGTGISPQDALTAFRVTGMDDDSRPRIVSYFAYVVTVKTRLLLWRWLPPHPSLSPVWLLSLGVGPILLFKFLRITLDDRAAALAGVAVYLVSAGGLSGATFLFHPAKPLANVLVIAMLYLCARVRRDASTPRLGDWRWIGVLVLMVIAPFVDELAIVCWVIPLVWCRGYFWPDSRAWPDRRTYVRNWLWYFVPIAAAGFLIFLAGPIVSGVVSPLRFDLADYLQRLAQPHRLSLRYPVWHAQNLLTPTLLPWSWARTMAPVADGPVFPIAIVVPVWTSLVLLAIVAVRGRGVWRPAGKLAVLMGAYAGLITLAFVFHGLDLAATGFYYGAIFSVLFAALVAAASTGLRASFGGAGAWVARIALAWIVAISIVNFVALSRSWRAHVDFKSVILLKAMPLPRETGEWRQLEAMEVAWRRKERQPSMGPTDLHYLSDAESPQPVAPWAESMAIWRRWRADRSHFLDGQPLNTRNLWIAVELTAEGR